MEEVNLVYLVWHQSFRKQLTIGTRIAHRGEDGIQDDVAGCPVIGMIKICGLVWFLIGIRRENVLAWVMGKDNTRAIPANEPDKGLACRFAVPQMTIGEA